MKRAGRPSRELSPPVAWLLILVLLAGQTAAAMHTGLPTLPADGDHSHAHHHHADHFQAHSQVEAPADHHDHHASGGVECPCLLCAGSAMANTVDAFPLLANKNPASSVETAADASDPPAYLRPPLRAPPLTA